MAYPVVKDALPCVLEFLEQTVTLQDIDDTNEQQQTLALCASCWNSAVSVNSVVRANNAIPQSSKMHTGIRRLTRRARLPLESIPKR